MSDNCTIVDGGHDEGAKTVEITELRASRRRLLLAADAERRSIERALHDGVQQELIGLAADVERASAAIETDPQAATEHLEEIRRGIRHVLDQMRTVANRIHPALDAGGLGPALRFAAAGAGVPTRVDVAVGASVPSEIVAAVYFCCLEVVGVVDGVTTTIAVRELGDALSFEIAADGEVGTSGPELRDRVEALGGSLVIRTEAARTVWAGSVPLRR